MARLLQNVKLYLQGDPDGYATQAVFEYEVTDGNASKFDTYVVSSPDFTKVFHDSGVSGEFWYDAVATIKTNEGI